MSERNQTEVTVKGTTWPLWQEGHGPTVLILHGSDGANAWRPLQHELAANHHCVLPVHPGFDGTARPDWLDRAADLANAYLEVIETSDWGPVHLVGHDLGGWVAAEMAVRNSNAIASLTLVSALGIHVPGAAPIDVFLRTDEQLAKDTFHDPRHAQSAIEAASDPDHAERLILNKEVAARLTWQPRGYDLDLQKWLHRIKTPTQIIWGAQDAILPVDFAEAWQSAIPGAASHRISACGHAPQVEQPEALRGHIHQFVANVRSAA